MNRFSHALLAGTGALCLVASAVSMATEAYATPTTVPAGAARALSNSTLSTAPNGDTAWMDVLPVTFRANEAASRSPQPAKGQPTADPKLFNTPWNAEQENSIFVTLLKRENSRARSSTHLGEAQLNTKNLRANVKSSSKSAAYPSKETAAANQTPRSETTTSTSYVPGAPASLIPVYKAAGARYGIPWTVLAAIHKTETDFKTTNCPESQAGAQGPMQFLPATFEEYAVKAPGTVGPPNIQNVDDAIYTTAHMLSSDGYSSSPSKAIFAYNHANWYVTKIETLAGL